MSSAENHNAHCHLLVLPGEIRNCIYEHLTEPIKVHLGRFHYSFTDFGDNHKRTTLGLTQTCRQLRSEFHPIYQSNVTPIIYVLDYGKYLRDFRTVERELIGELRLEYCHEVDVISMVELAKTTPKLHITFVAVDTGFYEDSLDTLTRLVDQRKNKLWASWVLQNAAYARYYVTDHELELGLEVHGKKPWMPWNVGGQTRTPEECDDVIAWMREVGLHGIIEMEQVVVR